MAFNVNEFRSNLIGDVQRASHFDVIIPPPAIMTNTGFDFKNLTFKCSNAVLPGKLMGTTERRTFGPIIKVVYGTIHSDVSLTFILTSSMKELSLLHEWQNNMTDENEEAIKYYNNYVSDIEIRTYAPNGDVNKRIKLIQAYPVNISNVELGWDAQNQYTTVTVDFAIKMWEEYPKVEEAVPVPNAQSFPLLDQGPFIGEDI